MVAFVAQSMTGELRPWTPTADFAAAEGVARTVMLGRLVPVAGRTLLDNGPLDLVLSAATPPAAARQHRTPARSPAWTLPAPAGPFRPSLRPGHPLPSRPPLRCMRRVSRPGVATACAQPRHGGPVCRRCTLPHGPRLRGMPTRPGPLQVAGDGDAVALLLTGSRLALPRGCVAGGPPGALGHLPGSPRRWASRELAPCNG